MSEYNLYCEFDAFEHLKRYPHYLEVGIDEEGKVHYAIPSHQEQLVKACCEKLGCTRQQLESMCPIEYYFDYITWLQMISGWVSVWTNFVKFHTLNEAQLKTLTKLKSWGVYEGELPEILGVMR